MPSTSLEDLPAELVTAILYALASPTALQSLIQASARCYKIFLLSKSDLLLTTLHQVFRPEIRPLVLMVHEAYRLPSFSSQIFSPAYRHNRDCLEAFMNQFSANHELGGAVLQSPTHSVMSQLRTVCTVEYLVEDYTNWVSNHLYSSKSYSLSNMAAAGMLPPPHAHQDLSHVERARLQRAFLCFEMFCVAMRAAGGYDMALSAKYAVQRNNDRFLNILQPWEREEFVCVLDYLTQRVEDIFDKLELDYIERMTEQFLNGEVDPEVVYINGSSSEPAESKPCDSSTIIPGALHPTLPEHETDGGQPRARMNHTSQFFTANSKRTLHTRYVENLITMGLPFLRRLFQARIKEQRRLVFANLSINGEMANLVAKKWIHRDQAHVLRRQGVDDFTTTLQRHRQLAPVAGGAAPALPGLAAAYPDNERILTFQGECVGRPNYAFLWTHGFTSVNVCSGGCDYLHRSLGYVFWDRARLEAMELVDRSHGAATSANPHKKLNRRRKRAEESAHQRLADMGFVVPVARDRNAGNKGRVKEILKM